MGLWVGHGDRFQAAIHHVADGQQKLFEHKGDVDEQLFFDFHQLIVIRQFQRNRHRFVLFTQFFDDLFHDLNPHTLWRGLYDALYTVARYKCNREMQSPGQVRGFGCCVWSAGISRSDGYRLQAKVGFRLERVPCSSSR